MDGAAVRQILVPFMGGPAIDAALAKAGLRLDKRDEATTQALVDLHHLEFPIGHSADARAVAEVIRWARWTCYW